MKSIDFESFKNPDAIYRGTDFWMLNGKLSDEEIVRQLTELKNKGFYSFIARTYVGLESDYPGADFMARMRTVVDKSKELGLKIYLQAGYMPDSIVDLPAEFSLRWLTVNKTTDTSSDALVMEKDGIEYRVGFSGEFIDMFSREAVEYYIKVCYEDFWQEFAPEFGNTVESVWIDEPSYPASHLPYPKGIEQSFLDRYGYKIEENLDALYIDREGYERVRYDYRRLLSDLLEEHFFKAISTWCSEHGIFMSGHLLFEETLEIQISRAAATMPFYKYLNIPGIDVLCAQQNWRRGRIKPFSPGEFRYRESMMTTPIQCASAARQAGKEHILAEMFGVTSEAFGPREQKHMLDCLAAHGINHRSIHGIFYSLKGRGKRLYPPHVNYYQPYFKSYGLMNDYTARLSRFVSIGRAVKDTLVIHPLESSYIDYTARSEIGVTGLQPSRASLTERDQLFSRLVSSLALSRSEFDLGDEGTIATLGSTKDGIFTVGKMSYKTVVLPYVTVLRSTTLTLLDEFKRRGGRVIILGDLPEMIDGRYEREKISKILESAEWVDDIGVLTSLVAPKDYTLSAPEGATSVMLSRRRSEEGEYYYLVNTDCAEKKKITLAVDGSYAAELWSCMDGTRKPLPVSVNEGKTNICIEISEGSNALLHLTPGKASKEKKKDGVKKVLDLGEEFKLVRDEKNALLLEYCRFKREGEELSSEYPILAVQNMLKSSGYVGEVTLEFSFTAEKAISGLSLALEDLSLSEITMNGERVENSAYRWYVSRDFEAVKLPDAREGENKIEIKRHFSPPDGRYGGGQSLFISRGGTSLEAMYLIGDFAVKMIPEPERNGLLRYSRSGIVLTDERASVDGELTSSGYPFYTGGVSLYREFDWTDKTDGAELVLDGVSGTVSAVWLNGHNLGALLAPPYRKDLGGALKKGKNTLVIHLDGTIRNLIGPHHNPYGERGGVRGDYDNSDLGWMGAVNKDDHTWQDHRTPDTELWCESYLLYPFGVYGARIEK